MEPFIVIWTNKGSIGDNEWVTPFKVGGWSLM